MMNKPVNPKQLELADNGFSDELEGRGIPDEACASAKIQKIEISDASDAVLAPAGPPDRDFDDFDWSSDPSVVLHEQRATAIYRNGWGGIVIRQRQSWPDEESDPFMVITDENAVVFMEAMAKVARE
jgi:hypothetical protein